MKALKILAVLTLGCVGTFCIGWLAAALMGTLPLIAIASLSEEI